MTDTMLTAETAALREGFEGALLVPGHDGYDEARSVWNGMIDKRPAAIAQCASGADVAAALDFGRAHGLEIAVRSGGHSVAGSSLTDGGMVIDLRRMNTVEIDSEARTARVAGGATWSDVDRACQPHGLATTGGRVSSTGVAGFTLGGGDGWLTRKLGFACDNLVSVELVTAEGRSVTASEDEHPDLFWALHGGGGNFGVATSFTFRLHPLPVTTLALLGFAPEFGPTVVRRYRDLIESDAPDELGGGVWHLTGPPEDFVPKDLVDKLMVMVIGVYAGPEAQARRALAPLLELGCDGEMIAELPYADIQCAFDGEAGLRNYWSAMHVATLPDEAVERYCAQAHDMIVPSPSEHVLLPWGGAPARQAADWPMSNRNITWCVHPFGVWQDPSEDERGTAWTKAVRDDMAPFATEGAYLNFTGDEGRDRIVAGYGGPARYQRLAAVKAKWDPDNVLRLNHNIEPLR